MQLWIRLSYILANYAGRGGLHPPDLHKFE